MHVELSRYQCVSTAALIACVALAACKGKETATTTDTTAAMNAAANNTTSTTTGDTSVRSGMADTGAAAANATGGQLSDANVAALVDEANAGDSTLAAAALPNLTSTGAKNFARLMTGEHHALHMEGLRVEKAQNITPVLPTPDPFKPAVEAEQTALSSMSKGPAYDSTYIAHEVVIHQAVIDWAGKQTPKNAAYQKYLKTAGPVYEKHLKEAESLQKKMAGSRT